MVTTLWLRLFPLMISLLFLTACTNDFKESLVAGEAVILNESARPIVIDTDMAADDWMAILYLLMRPDVDVRAITVTGAGEAHCEPGVRHALDLAALAGRPDIPVTCGGDSPLNGDQTFPAEWRDNVDNLFGLQLPKNPNTPAKEPAVQLLGQIIQEAVGELSIVALGPLTNLGQLLETQPELAGQIAEITIMGGAVYVPGNVGISSDINNDKAEWNLFVDPHAARIVFDSGAPISLIPLDATNEVPATIDYFERFKQDRESPAAEFVYQVLATREDDLRAGLYYFWDPLAAVAFTNPEVVSYEQMPLIVEKTEGPDRGATLVSEDGMLANVAVDADQSRFEDLFLLVLNGRSP